MSDAGSGGVSLPGGSGVSTGLGEAMRLDLNTGQAVYTLPLKVPAGVNDFGPTLRLAYSSAAGSGPFGRGWDVETRHIRRRLDLGVPFDESGATGVVERFLDGDAELAEMADGTFAPLADALFHRYRRVGEGLSLIHI